MTTGHLWLVCALSLSVSVPVRSDRDDVFRLLVLHTNDMHAHIAESGTPCRPGLSSGCRGGFPRLATAVRRERELAARDTRVDGTLFLNAGDTFQGTEFYAVFKWTVAARMLPELGIDAMTLGNHEFDDGVKDVQSFLHNITIPVVSSNLDLSGEPSLANVPNLTKSKVLTIKGRKIGIVGYLTPETMFTSSAGRVKILPEIPSIQAEVNHLKNRGINIIIALGHSGFDVDRTIAKEVEHVDLVVGGHSHTFLYSGNPPDIEKPSGPYPVWVEQSKTKKKVPVVQASQFTKYLGKIFVEFNEEGDVINSYGNPILLDSSIEQDPELLAKVNSLEKLIESRTQQVIGSTNVVLEGIDQYCRFKECNFGNFITDSFINYNVRENVDPNNLPLYWTDAPIAIMQGGGMRFNINASERSGNITIGDLMKTMPFENYLGKVALKGSEILEAFEFSFRRYDGITFHGEFLQVSGLKVVIDLSQPSGKRVKSIYVRCGNCTVIDYQLLDLNAYYTVIMSKFLFEGGDGFTFNKSNNKFHRFGKTDLQVVKEEIGIKSPIWPVVDQRIVMVNSRHISTATLGNRKLDNGVKDAQSFSHKITVPIAASNFDISTKPSPANMPSLVKSKVLTINGRKFGIFDRLTSMTADDGVADKVIGTRINSTKRTAKMDISDSDKYSRDINALFKKYEAADKKNRARVYFKNQLKHAVALTSEYIKKGYNESEEVLKTIIEKIESEDSVLGEKLNNFYDKARELSEISEDINKYVLYVDKDDKTKIAYRPLLEQNVADLIKKFESKVFGAVIKKNKRKL